MSGIQAGLFFLILILVTTRTLIFKSVANYLSPNSTAWAIGSGTFVSTVLLLPIAHGSGVTSLAESLAWQGIASGVLKGMILTALLVAQQKLITKSLSATTYVFPVAIGLIGIMDAIIFKSPISLGGLLSMALLATAGIAFSLFGHLKTMDTSGKLMFIIMVISVVGFSVCDRIGIPASGWYLYLMYTGLGNMVSAALLFRKFPTIKWLPWLCVALSWSLPELIFNYAISSSLPVSYGYLAICLRVPILMMVALLVFKEGRPTSQIIFGVFSMAASIPAFL